MADVIKNADRLEAKSVDYTEMQAYFTQTSDILKGQTAIVKAGKVYLPRYPDELDSEFTFRLEYAKFTNVFRDMVEGLASKPFEQEISFVESDDKNIAIAPTDEMELIADDVDGSGNNMTIFAMDVFFNAIAYSMDWIFVDHPPKTTAELRTKADEKALGIRPYWSRVSCLNVYEVRSKIIQGKETLTYIRIFEPATGDTPKQFRIMENVDGVATFEIWSWNETMKDYTMTETGVITIGVIPMVPVITGRRNGKSWQTYPPMRDAGDLQIKLYRSESNLEVTKTYAAYPMLVGQGVKPYEVNGVVQKIIRGPGITLYAPFTGAGSATDWHYIEPGGQMLVFLQTDIDKTTAQLRELGRQPLTVSSGNLTVITTAVAAGKARSAVKAWAIGLNDALTMAYHYTALWLAQSVGPSTKVYLDFDEFAEAGKDIDALLSMSDKGKISDETLWEEMQRRKVLPANFDPEREKKRLLAQVPNEPDVTMNPNPELFE